MAIVPPFAGTPGGAGSYVPVAGTEQKRRTGDSTRQAGAAASAFLSIVGGGGGVSAVGAGLGAGYATEGAAAGAGAVFGQVIPVIGQTVGLVWGALAGQAFGRSGRVAARREDARVLGISRLARTNEVRPNVSGGGTASAGIDVLRATQSTTDKDVLGQITKPRTIGSVLGDIFGDIGTMTPGGGPIPPPPGTPSVRPILTHEQTTDLSQIGRGIYEGRMGAREIRQQTRALKSRAARINVRVGAETAELYQRGILGVLFAGLRVPADVAEYRRRYKT